MDGPRRIPIHRSLNRPSLLLGGERELVLMAMFTAALIAFSASSWMQIVFGFFFWVVVHGLLVSMAKADPMMSKIYLRHVRYGTWYPARGGEHALPATVPEWED